MQWIILLISGVIIGAVARLVLPGDQHMPIWMHILLGVGGALIGGWLADLIGVGDTSGLDVLQFIISVIVAAVLIVVVERVSTGSKV